MREFHSAHNNGSKSTVFSSDLQAAVRAELQLMLEAPVFAQSGRCKRFLSFVISQTLSGHAHELKERTIGINVFDRAADYDTGADSIVRVTSNEVRKRIGQFYRESQTEHAIQVELPRGGYVPEFRLCAVRCSDGAEKVPEQAAGSGEASVVFETHPAPAEFSDAEASAKAPVAVAEAPRARHSRRPWLISALAIVLLVAVGAAIEVWRSRAGDNCPHLWDGFQNSKVPILICLGTHDIPLPKKKSSVQADLLADLALYREMIPVDDAAVATAMGGLLGKQGIPFRVVTADKLSYSNFKLQPVILIGSVDNQWTQRITQNLLYRIEVKYPITGQLPVASIVDAKQPPSALWTTDFSIPLSSRKSDYAIVARIDDAVTGVPVIVNAGLGNNGSLAASELLTSGAIAASLSHEPQCHGKSNFEAVVETAIIDTRRGPPHLLRLTCW